MSREYVALAIMLIIINMMVIVPLYLYTKNCEAKGGVAVKTTFLYTCIDQD